MRTGDLQEFACKCKSLLILGRKSGSHIWAEQLLWERTQWSGDVDLAQVSPGWGGTTALAGPDKIQGCLVGTELVCVEHRKLWVTGAWTRISITPRHCTVLYWHWGQLPRVAKLFDQFSISSDYYCLCLSTCSSPGSPGGRGVTQVSL